MKKLRLIQLLVILSSMILLLPSCEKDKNDNQSGAVVDLTFPADWEVINNFSDLIVLVGKSPAEGPNDDFLENINVSRESAEGLTLESYYVANLNAIETLYNYGFVFSTDTIINGLNSKKLIFTATINNIDLEFMDFMFYVDGYGYVVTCTAREDTFGEYKSVFEQIAGTFTIVL